LETEALSEPQIWF